MESLAVPGRRLNDTPIQRQGKSYAPDVLTQIAVEEAGQRLHGHFVDGRHLILAQGEYKHQRVWLTNSGTRPIRELWLLPGEDDELWIDAGDDAGRCCPFYFHDLYLDLHAKIRHHRAHRKAKLSGPGTHSVRGNHTNFHWRAFIRPLSSHQETSCNSLSSCMPRTTEKRTCVCCSSSERYVLGGLLPPHKTDFSDRKSID